MVAIKRMISFTGGGPAVGLSLGFLQALQEKQDITFDIWTGSCIGAWVTTAYHQADPGYEFKQTVDFFKGIFRPDATYENFPIPTAFAPNYIQNYYGFVNYVLNPNSYRNLIVPQAIYDATEVTLGFLTDPSRWNVGNFNNFILNGVLAANPIARFMISAIYKSPTNSLATMYYPDSQFLNSLRFERLFEDRKPTLYHNAYNLTQKKLEIFSNRPTSSQQEKMSLKSLCAGSALPYIQEPVQMNGETYCEGATVDILNCKALIKHHPDLNEIWINRLLDLKQINKPNNLYDSLNNLIMLFAASKSEDNIRDLKGYIHQKGLDINIIDLPVSYDINYDWSYSNLEHAMEEGYRSAIDTINAYKSDKAGLPLSLAYAAE